MLLPGFETSLPARSVQGSPRLSVPDPGLDPFSALYRRSRYLAACVEASTGRSDCRTLRSAVLLAVTSTAVPAWGRPRERWQERGASVGQGPQGIRAHVGLSTGRWVSPETVRRHLVALERAGAIVRSPGELLLRRKKAKGLEDFYRRPDTIHVLTSPSEAEWWRVVGFARLDAHPEARTNLRRWRRLYGRWREEAALPLGDPGSPAQSLLELIELAEARSSEVPALTDEHPPPAPVPPRAAGASRESRDIRGRQPSQGAAGREAGPSPQASSRTNPTRLPPSTAARVDVLLELAKALERPADPIDLIEAARLAGAPILGKRRGEVASRPRALRFALARYGLELRGGQSFESPGGWVAATALNLSRTPRAGPEELGRFLRWASEARGTVGG